MLKRLLESLKTLLGPAPQPQPAPVPVPINQPRRRAR